MDATSLSAAQLKNMVDRGILMVIGHIPVTRYETPEYKTVEHLRGELLSISEASREYEIPKQTISRWIKRGIIDTQGVQGNKLLIDRADIAYCQIIYKSKQGTGRWMFDKDGTRYVKKQGN